jgi:phosphoenolpyruvate carboxykinase (ATP)
MQAYVLNTGSIGATDGSPGEKITIRVSTEIMKQIAKEGIEWARDPDWSYEVPKRVPGVKLERYTPPSYYSAEDYSALVRKLRGERRDWLARFPGLDPAIPRAIEPG